MRKTTKITKTAHRTTPEEVAENLNKKFGPGTVVFANQTGDATKVRRPTGLAQIDLALAGGFPGGTVNSIGGLESVGKDAFLNSLFRTHQEVMKEESAIYLNANEPGGYDKGWARKAGVKIAFSDEEIEAYEKAREIKLDKVTRKEMQTGLGTFMISTSRDSEAVFTSVLHLAGTGTCKLLVINSLQMLLPHVNLQDYAVEDNQSGLKEAALLTQMIKKWGKSSCLGDEEKNPYALQSKGIWYPTLICIKQARANLNAGRSFYSREWKTNTGAHAFRHAVSMDITLQSVFQQHNKEIQDGKRIKWTVTKGKHGTHEGLTGQLDLYYSSGFDPAADLLDALSLQGMTSVVGHGKLIINGPNGEITGARNDIISLLRTDKNVFEFTYKAVMATLETPYLLRESPTTAS